MLSKNTKPNAEEVKMNKVIIGCDPDSSKSGIAVYVNGELVGLKSMTLMEVIDCFNEMGGRYFF